MDSVIFIADRRTAYAELSQPHPDPIGLLRFRVGRGLSVERGRVPVNIGAAVVACAPRERQIVDVESASNMRGVELIHSMACGYSLRLLVIENIENLLSDPEARATFREQRARIEDAARQCRCPIWVIAPDGWVGGDFMRFTPQVAAQAQPERIAAGVGCEALARRRVREVSALAG